MRDLQPTVREARRPSRGFKALTLRALLAPLGVLLVLTGLLSWQVLSLISANRAAVRSEQLVSRLQHLELLAVSAETNLRGYTLSGEERFLRSMVRLEHELVAAVTSLEHEVAEHGPGAPEAALAIREGLAQWMRFAADEVAGRGTDPPARVALEERLLNGLVGAIEALSDQEQGRYRRHDAHVDRLAARVLWTSLATALALGAALAWGSRRQLRELAGSYEALLAGKDRHAAALAEREREARHALRAREEFLTVAAHELRTPLTSLTLHLQMLSCPAGEGDVVFERRLRRSLKQVDRLRLLAETLLDVSQLSSGDFVLGPEAVDLSALTGRVCEGHREELERARCKLEVALPGGVLAQADPRRVEQILDSLLSNAIKFGAGRPISVTTCSGREQALLSVEDHGIGISPQVLPRLFQRFERAVPSTHYGGLGLGLYVAHRLATAMGGQLDVESSPGQGATFRLRLPLAVNQESRGGMETFPGNVSGNFDVPRDT